MACGAAMARLLLSPFNNPAARDPAYAIKPETLQDVIAQSTDFFFVLPLLNKFGIDILGTAPEVHPVSLGFFNFAGMLIFMLFLLLLMDKRGEIYRPPRRGRWACFSRMRCFCRISPSARRRLCPPRLNASDSWREARLGRRG